jgi:hypothetical protein
LAWRSSGASEVPEAVYHGATRWYTNLIPITSPFLQATLHALPGEVLSNSR